MASSLPVVYEFGSFQLDRDERVLRRGDITIPLTPKATEILLILVERRGHIVEEADLMRQVWPDTAVEESNLTQNIYTLRRVLSDVNGKCRFIETVPRRGYRFVGPVGLLAPETAEAAVDQALAPAEDEMRILRPPSTGLQSSVVRNSARMSAGISGLSAACQDHALR